MMMMERTRHVKDTQNREEVVIFLMIDDVGRMRRNEQLEVQNSGIVKSMQRHSA